MSETNPQEWVWQGFTADSLAVATEAKKLTDEDTRAGVWVPQQGQPPMPWNKAKTRFMWAVSTRRGNPIPTPAGCDEADPGYVGRLVGA